MHGRSDGVRVYFGREKGLALAREGVATGREQRRCRAEQRAVY
jgi:hypothetical protein